MRIDVVNLMPIETVNQIHQSHCVGGLIGDCGVCWGRVLRARLQSVSEFGPGSHPLGLETYDDKDAVLVPPLLPVPRPSPSIWARRGFSYQMTDGVYHGSDGSLREGEL